MKGRHVCHRLQDFLCDSAICAVDLVKDADTVQNHDVRGHVYNVSGKHSQ